MAREQFVTNRLERLAYGGYFMGQNLIYFLVYQFLMLFYTDVVGITAGAVGTMFLIARIFDAVNDPIMGIIVDKTNLEGGKFIPWIKLVIFLMPLTTVILFIKVGGGGINSLIYAYITYLIWGIIYTISDVPIFALATVMTHNSNERVTLISIGRIGAGLGSVIISLFFMTLLSKIAWTGTVLLLATLALLSMLPLRYLGRERYVYQQKEVLSLKKIFSFVLNNKYLLIFYGAIIMASLTNTSTVSINYFAIYNLGNESYISTLTIANMIPMLLVPFVLPPLIKRYGKKKIFIMAFIVAILSSLVFYLIGYSNIVWVHLFTTIKGIAQVPTFMIGLFTVDCIEYGTYTTNERAEGISFSLQTFTAKLSAAVAGAISGFVLERVGYEAGVIQTPQTLNGIWNMYVLYPIFGAVIAIIIMWRYYDLTEKQVDDMILFNTKSKNI
ncbi:MULTISPECIES: MFS transporter [Turicibacter]|jgi:glycoside/pentoside/hexuronide transporter|uniref:MFS transporter n=3 Tax=Turicibacter sanguinis TaxID=154288 RepID=A0A173QWR4_9FIRM|nr:MULTISPECIES: glycoside-pentoside-hexuronide (GPH):cation symporter [Turicibacter]EFF63913.1 transporter, major facilitator family protein [Turicibacter sanguinis PC909]MBP3905449.1 MFS transporter [Turicibacter sp.]MCU7190646.1 glycoside-pentoside-hexuronide (GPH):cation symporter [Turicibacter sanguinis]MCU7196309.1 glycoside-pentoside-hexuronide (GPH):cation symporter [Turicibacter sanguinis]MCU7203497.1 glycoside-pentoside-hexuronide (GPH):cation symporter [Turicibacter sanguinis]